MKEPIVVVSDDVDLFSSVRDAERYLEAPEVRTGVRVLDATGKPLRAVIIKRFLAEVVRLEEDPNAAANIQELRTGLLRLIGGRGRIAEESLADLPLDELIAQAQKYLTR
jgi:hypothetical protein